MYIYGGWGQVGKGFVCHFVVSPVSFRWAFFAVFVSPCFCSPVCFSPFFVRLKCEVGRLKVLVGSAEPTKPSKAADSAV